MQQTRVKVQTTQPIYTTLPSNQLFFGKFFCVKTPAKPGFSEIFMPVNAFLP